MTNEALKKRILNYINLHAIRIHYKESTIEDVKPAYRDLVRYVLRVKYGEDEYGNAI